MKKEVEVSEKQILQVKEFIFFHTNKGVTTVEILKHSQLSLVIVAKIISTLLNSKLIKVENKKSINFYYKNSGN